MARKILHILTESYVAAEALLAHRIVIVSSVVGECRYPDSAPDTQMIGVTLAGAASGEVIEVVTLGNALLTVNGNSVSIVDRDWIESVGTVGIGIKRDIADGANVRELLGQATEASSTDGDEIVVKINIVPFASS